MQHLETRFEKIPVRNQFGRMTHLRKQRILAHDSTFDGQYTVEKLAKLMTLEGLPVNETSEGVFEDSKGVKYVRAPIT